MDKIVKISQQITQGMGYLHHRGIIHKDLKTKNIFLENGHAIISDFGLVNVAQKLCVNTRYAQNTTSFVIWLRYLAPEIMRSLNFHAIENEKLPFTKSSDIFAFGTVWFELLTSDLPWKNEHPEAVIWKVGKGNVIYIRLLTRSILTRSFVLFLFLIDVTVLSRRALRGS